jgi:hypothetical protein
MPDDKKKQEAEAEEAEPANDSGKIPASKILQSLRKHQEDVEREVADRDDLERVLNLASFPKWGEDAEAGGK